MNHFNPSKLMFGRTLRTFVSFFLLHSKVTLRTSAYIFYKSTAPAPFFKNLRSTQGTLLILRFATTSTPPSSSPPPPLLKKYQKNQNKTKKEARKYHKGLMILKLYYSSFKQHLWVWVSISGRKTIFHISLLLWKTW